MDTEINELLKRLNDIQQDYYRTNVLTEKVKREWCEIVKTIKTSGYKLKKTYGLKGCVWDVKRIKVNEAIYGKWIMDEHEKNHNSECTTRAIYFCTNHNIPYQDIRRLQNEMARLRFRRGRCWGWNTETVWGVILSGYGFTKVKIGSGIRCGRVAMKLKDIDTKVVIHSANHLSSCYRGSIVDDWDSRMKVATHIYVKNEMVERVKTALGV